MLGRKNNVKGTYVECCDSQDQRTFGGDSQDQRTFGGKDNKYPTLARSSKTGIEVCSCPTPAPDDDVTIYTDCCAGFEPLNNYQACKIHGAIATISQSLKIFLQFTPPLDQIVKLISAQLLLSPRQLHRVLRHAVTPVNLSYTAKTIIIIYWWVVVV
jgi:hypothetical protein